MNQLLHLCIFLALTAMCAISETSMTPSLNIITLSDHTCLTCCHQEEHNYTKCSFYIDSREIIQKKTSNSCCELIITGQQLLEKKTDQLLQTSVNVHCATHNNHDPHISGNVTITVWRLSLSGNHAVILLFVLGALVLFSLLVFLSLCIWCCVTKIQGRRGQFHPVSYRTQALECDTQGVSTGIEEEQEDTAEVAGDEIFYATVNHSSSGVSSAVKFEPGTEYATVVIN